jgi:hypothetical protein
MSLSRFARFFSPPLSKTLRLRVSALKKSTPLTSKKNLFSLTRKSD